jgi:CubicO group peptidase (beta-lactamase class C family)
MSKNNGLVRVLRVVMPAVAVVCLVVLPPWDIVWAWLKPLPDSVQEQVEGAPGHGLDGIIVYVDKVGQKPALYAAGWKNRENRIPADPRALFKIASIGKLYVAAAASKLVADQRLSLDDTLAEHFPELVGRVENADIITLKMMLQHRSGIPNLTDHPDFPWGDPPKSPEAALKYALDQPADFEPGQSYAYSNTNYLLISELLDRTLGYSHQRFIKEEILTPLGLTHTFGSLKEVDLDEVMSGYAVGWEHDVKENNHGSMLATAEDVGIFLRALNDGSLLNEQEQSIYSSVYVYEHTGLVPGYQSIARYHEDIDAVVVQFVSTNGGNAWTISEVIYSRIIKILRGQ